MFVKEVLVHNAVGLNAMPATFFIMKANEFHSAIWVEKKERRINGKALLGILSLDIVNGDVIRIIADGRDEQSAVESLTSLIQSEFYDSNTSDDSNISNEMKAQSSLRFKVCDDGYVEVCIQTNDGHTYYTDGTTKISNLLYVINFTHWTNILKDLEILINDPNALENDLQKYFEEHSELLLGDDYDVVLPQAVITYDDENSWKSDFVLTPCNQNDFAKILELKIPKMNIMNRQKSGHTKFSAKLWDAIQQIKDYKRAFDNKNVRERFKCKYNVDVYKPDLHIIAGRNSNFYESIEFLDLQREQNIKIETWDMALERLRKKYT